MNVPLLDVTLVITRGAFPVSDTAMLSRLLLPSATIPNGTDFRSTLNAGTVPFPVAFTVSGDVDPLCVNIMDAVFAPAPVGESVIPNFLEEPGDNEALIGPTVNSVLVDRTLLIVSVGLPVFLTVTLSVFLPPTGTSPSESFLVLTEKAGAWTPAGTCSAEYAPRRGGCEPLSCAYERGESSATQMRPRAASTVFMKSPAPQKHRQDTGNLARERAGTEC